MSKAIIFFVGIIAWLALVNILLSLQDDLLDLESTAEQSSAPINSTETLSPRNSVLSIRIKDD